MLHDFLVGKIIAGTLIYQRNVARGETGFCRFAYRKNPVSHHLNTTPQIDTNEVPCSSARQCS
jgi:hypothetical protein